MFSQGRRAISREACQPMMLQAQGGDMRMAGGTSHAVQQAGGHGAGTSAGACAATAQDQGKQPHRVWRGRAGGGGEA